MPTLSAKFGDTVSFRNAAGETTNVLVNGTQPAAPGTGDWSLSTDTTGGTLTAATYSYRISKIVNGIESGVATAKTQATAGVTSTVTVTLPGVAGVIYKIYGRVGGTELLMNTSAAGGTSFVDTGSATPAGALPTADGRIGIHNFGTHQNLTTIVKATAIKDVNKYFKR